MNPQDFKRFFRPQEVEGSFAVADPNLKLRGRPGLDLLTLLALFPSVISSFFTQNKGGGGGGGGGPGLSPRSATVSVRCFHGPSQTALVLDSSSFRPDKIPNSFSMSKAFWADIRFL